MGRRSGPDVCEAISPRRRRVRGTALPQASMRCAKLTVVDHLIETSMARVRGGSAIRACACAVLALTFMGTVPPEAAAQAAPVESTIFSTP